MTMATTKPSGGCGGDSCDVRDPWPLHHVRHRGIFCRLCSSCVLKYHPGSFCTLCFVLLEAGSPATSPAAPAVVHCSKCPSVSHFTCLPNPDLASQFVCPSCKNPEGFSYFLKGNQSDRKRRMIDVESAKVLLVAARLAAKSMSRAAAVVRGEAEKKVREAAVARKRTREMLERAFLVCKKNERNAAAAAAVTPKPAVAVTPKPAVAATPKPAPAEESKKKTTKVGGSTVDQKRTQSREIEKWMRCHEPVSILAGQGKGEKDKLEGGAPVEVKSRTPNSIGKEEREKKVNLLSSQSGGGVKKEERILVGSGEKGPRLPQATQDALVSRTNPKSIFTASPSTASLRS